MVLIYFSWLLYYEIIRLEKIKWMENYIEVREVSITTENIWDEWHDIELISLNQVQVIHFLPEILL